MSAIEEIKASKKKSTVIHGKKQLTFGVCNKEEHELFKEVKGLVEDFADCEITKKEFLKVLLTDAKEKYNDSDTKYLY